MPTTGFEPVKTLSESPDLQSVAINQTRPRRRFSRNKDGVGHIGFPPARMTSVIRADEPMLQAHGSSGKGGRRYRI